MSDLQVFPISVLGGLQQSKPLPEPGDMETLSNFIIFRGRLGLRPPIEITATLKDDQGTPANVDNVLALASHDNKLYAVAYSTSQTDVYLIEMDAQGGSPTNKGVIWSAVSDVTTILPVMASIEGGDATTPENRLYISEYNQNEVTKYYDGTTINTLQADLDADSIDEDITFSLVFPYKFHLWGTGFYEPGAQPRPEMLRFSTPGLIPANDIAGGTNPREWHVADHRSVGTRGRRITCITEASANMIVCQNNATHALFGFDADSWQTRIVSPHLGAVGPYAAATDGTFAYIWTSDGPYVTDGRQMTFIGEAIKETIQEVSGGEETRAVYSPDDNIVYFCVQPVEETEPTLYIAYDTIYQRWMDGVWLDGAGTATKVGVGAATFLKSQTLPSPKAAPSSLAASLSAGLPSLSWTNGDTALGVQTVIHRDTSSGFTAGAGNEIARVSSGVATYDDTSAAAKTTYYYQVRHVRNSNFSAASNEPSIRTALAAPTNVSALSIVSPDGVRIALTHNSNNSDVKIQRKAVGTGTFADLITLSSQASGAVSYDDTTGTSGSAYDFRVRAEESGETASEWSATVTATAGLAADPKINSTSHTTVDNSGIVSTTVTWTGNGDFEVGVDKVKVYTIIDGGTPVLRTTWTATNTSGNGSYKYTWGSCPNGSTLQFKLEVYKGGTTLNDTNYETAGGFDPCSEVTPDPENTTPEDLVPDGDISNSGYTTAPLWSKLDEATADGDTTHVVGQTVVDSNSSVDSFEVSMTNPSTAPTTNGGHKIQVWIAKGGTSSLGFIQVTATIKKNTTTVATKNWSTFSGSYVMLEATLTEAEAANLSGTDYDNVRVLITTDTVGEDTGGATVTSKITKVVFQVPVPN